MKILSLAWKYKSTILATVLGIWLFLSLSCPGPSPLVHGQSSIATQIKIVEKIKTEIREVKVLVPSPPQVIKIEKMLGDPLPPNPLNILEVPVLPDGGKVVPFLQDDGTVGGKVYPNKTPKFKWLRSPYLEGEYELINRGIDIGGGFDALQIGRTTLGVKGGVQQEDSLEGLRVYVKGRIRVEF